MTQTSRATLRAARVGDLQSIELLLKGNDLPTAGVREAIDGFFVAEDGDELVGAIGVEHCGPRYGLLRSAVVLPSRRGEGIGRRLVERAIAGAKRDGLAALYLLTTTAEKYFPNFGFIITTRGEVPEPVQATVEFREACPASATVMSLRLH